MDLTIAYITNRENHRIDWFVDALERQLQTKDEVSVIVISLRDIEFFGFTYLGGPLIKAYTSKPCIWSGPNRITKQDWWSASSVRNTALCLCKTSHIAFIDDLSVLMPKWLHAVREAMAGNYIVCGAYQKVKKLEVEDGIVKGFEHFPQGVDTRWREANGDITPCGGQWLFGCSVAGPVEAFLSVNGWPEDLCDGMGFEDVCMGYALQNAGWQLKYDRRMLTLESEEDHHVEPAMKRSDYGISPNDKSHAALHIAQSSKWFPNSFGTGGIRALRERVLAGEPFPIPKAPDREWFTGQLLKDL